MYVDRHLLEHNRKQYRNTGKLRKGVYSTAEDGIALFCNVEQVLRILGWFQFCLLIGIYSLICSTELGCLRLDALPGLHNVLSSPCAGTGGIQKSSLAMGFLRCLRCWLYPSCIKNSLGDCMSLPAWQPRCHLEVLVRLTQDRCPWHSGLKLAFPLAFHFECIISVHTVCTHCLCIKL